MIVGGCVLICVIMTGHGTVLMTHLCRRRAH